ncbi:MAG: hypothetical protein EPO02_13835 [Nitrospirae bacterium]|nr:MAG: hypothetical protein EPO02_13835 [Nitrospirota bacterium]
MPLIRKSGLRINPHHPAAHNMQALVISTGNTFIDIHRRQRASVTGSIPGIRDSYIGNAGNFGGVDGNYATFSGRSTVVPTKVTFACILKVKVTASQRRVILGTNPDPTSTGPSLECGDDLAITMANGSGSYPGAMNVVSGGYYFYAASTSQLGGAAPLNAGASVIVRLDTNRHPLITIGANTNVGCGTPSGTIYVGSSTANRTANADIAWAFYANTYLSPSQLLAWAYDPWSIFSRADDRAALWSKGIIAPTPPVPPTPPIPPPVVGWADPAPNFDDYSDLLLEDGYKLLQEDNLTSLLLEPLISKSYTVQPPTSDTWTVQSPTSPTWTVQ